MDTHVFKKNGCIIHVNTSRPIPVMAWVDDGQTVFYVRKSEVDMFKYDPEKALMFMTHMVNRGIRRCSRCGWEGKKKEFRHHMAELLCIACCADDVEEYEKDIRTGNVCRICGKPRSRCCC